MIPAYNAESHLAEVIEGVQRFIPKSQVIVVDDGSSDSTSEIASSLGAILIRHESNQGKGVALLSGIKEANRLGFAYVITIDADCQHDPKEIPKFLEAQNRTGAEIIIGNRMWDTKNMPLVRICSNKLTSLFLSLRTRCRIPDSQSGYRLLKTDIFNDIKIVTTRYETESEMLIKAAKAGARIDHIPVRTIYAEEKSSINPFTDSLRFLHLVIRSFFR